MAVNSQQGVFIPPGLKLRAHNRDGGVEEHVGRKVLFCGDKVAAELHNKAKGTAAHVLDIGGDLRAVEAALPASRHPGMDLEGFVGVVPESVFMLVASFHVERLNVGVRLPPCSAY